MTCPLGGHARARLGGRAPAPPRQPRLLQGRAGLGAQRGSPAVTPDLAMRCQLTSLHLDKSTPRPYRTLCYKQEHLVVHTVSPSLVTSCCAQKPPWAEQKSSLRACAGTHHLVLNIIQAHTGVREAAREAHVCDRGPLEQRAPGGRHLSDGCEAAAGAHVLPVRRYQSGDQAQRGARQAGGACCGSCKARVICRDHAACVSATCPACSPQATQGTRGKGLQYVLCRHLMHARDIGLGRVTTRECRRGRTLERLSHLLQLHRRLSH